MGLKNNILKYRKDLLIVLALLLLAFWTRFYKLSETAVYPDEITWMVRAKETALAIKTNNFNYFKTAWWMSSNDTEAIALPLTVISGFPLIYLGKGQSVVSRNLLQDYIAARLPVIIFTTVFIGIYYLFVKKISSRKIALLSSIFLIFDPIFVANSKLVMNDIFLTAFTFISIAAFMFFDNLNISILVSSFFSALAFLTKPNGLIIIPFFLILSIISPKNRKNNLFKLVLVSVCSYFFISILWPASWDNLLLAIPEYILRQRDLVSRGINNFFFGHLTENPPFYYYFFEFLIRSPLLTVVSLLASITLIFNKKTVLGKQGLYILIYILLFLIVISFSAKKLGIRYALPVLPWIYLLVGYVVVYFTEKIKHRWKKYVAYSVIIIYFAAIFIYFFPYHNLFYNMLVGGPAGAAKYTMVGICEGTKPAVDYILRCYPDVKVIAGLGCGSSVAPYYYPNRVTNAWRDEKIFYVESYYLQLQKDKELLDFVKKNSPAKVINEKGFNIAYIYTKPGVDNVCESNTLK